MSTRHVLTLVDGRVVVIAVVLLMLAGVIALVADRRDGTGWRAFFALCGTALIATLTIGNRGLAVSDNGFADDFTWWTRNWGTLPSLMSSDIGWWLNVALFRPGSRWLDDAHEATHWGIGRSPGRRCRDRNTAGHGPVRRW